MIQLFDWTATSFDSGGTRIDDALSCTVTEERNGGFTLEMVYPINGAVFSDLSRGAIIYAPFDETENSQPFRIHKISKDLGGKVIVYAQHISYELSKQVLLPMTAQSCQNAVNSIPSHICSQVSGYTQHTFTFSTNIVSGTQWNIKAPRSVKSALGGSEGSLLDVYHGEYRWNKWAVNFLQSRGNDYGLEVVYGYNLLSLVNETDISGVFTHIIPFWKKDVEGVETVVYSSTPTKLSGDADGLTFQRTEVVDFSDSFETQPTVAQLNTKAQSYASSHTYSPINNLKVDFVGEMIDRTVWNYKLLLCDTITIKCPPLGISVPVKIVKTEYDCLKHRYKSIELGNAKLTLLELINRAK